METPHEAYAHVIDAHNARCEAIAGALFVATGRVWRVVERATFASGRTATLCDGTDFVRVSRGTGSNKGRVVIDGLIGAVDSPLVAFCRERGKRATTGDITARGDREPAAVARQIARTVLPALASIRGEAQQRYAEVEAEAAALRVVVNDLVNASGGKIRKRDIGSRETYFRASSNGGPEESWVDVSATATSVSLTLESLKPDVAVRVLRALYQPGE